MELLSIQRCLLLIAALTVTCSLAQWKVPFVNPSRFVPSPPSLPSVPNFPGRSTTRNVANSLVDVATEIAIVAGDPQAIFPGTRWCGAGTRAKSDNELGLFRGSDACCRAHDKCADNIPSKSFKHGLQNSRYFTLSHCDCDERFYNCLANDASIPSKEIGYTYFNLLRAQCFRKDRPVLRCLHSTGFALTRRCKTYEFDQESEERFWQWFDAQEF